MVAHDSLSQDGEISPEVSLSDPSVHSCDTLSQQILTRCHIRSRASHKPLIFRQTHDGQTNAFVVRAMHDPAGDVREQPSPQEGRYGNYFRVGFNQFEFLIVVGQSYAEGEPETPHTYIVTTPSYAKAFAELLQVSVTEYEQ